MRSLPLNVLAASAALLFSAVVQAQQPRQLPPPEGEPVTLEQAKKN